MNIEEIEHLYKLCGFSVKKLQNNYFIFRGWINYSFPTLHDINYNTKDLDKLKWKYPLTILKIKARIRNSYEYVLETDNYKIELFSSKTRNQIRKSLKECSFRRPTLDEVLDYGLQINQHTLGRQGRDDKYLTNKTTWTKYISSFYSNNEVIFLGAYFQNRMIGYIITYEVNGKFIILHPFFDKQYSSSNPMNGLIYTLINQLLKLEQRVIISYGLDSFYHLPNLSKFKESMKFQRVPTTRIFLLNPLLAALIKLIIFITIKVLKKRNVTNSYLRKIISIYQGYRILAKVSR